MRIVCISDTHGLHTDIKSVPDGDVLIHAGDLTDQGVPQEIFETFGWLSSQPHERIIAIAGNHDFDLQRIPELASMLKVKFPRVDLLMDEQTMIGNHFVYGSPWQPWFHDWAFNFAPGPAGAEQARKTWARIPDDTAILVTHGPPKNMLDETLGHIHVGCPQLSERIANLKTLRLHVFGHIHESYGTQTVSDVLYVNACTCDSQYYPTQPPIVIELDEQGSTIRVAPN